MIVVCGIWEFAARASRQRCVPPKPIDGATTSRSRYSQARALARSTPLKEKQAMAKGYWIVRVSVRDQERYPQYLTAARPAFEKFGAKFVIRGGRFETMEGTSRDRNVVVEFIDYATAIDCYGSPEYQSAKAIRQKHADADFVIIEGA
jgi:uncharacterized protein (DUF1330 family)